MITKLTHQQEELMVSYQQAWKAVYLSTAPIERNRVLDVLEDVFKAYPESPTMPEVIFFNSPYAAFNAELRRVTTGNFNDASSDRIINEVTNLMTLQGEGQARTDLWFDLSMDLHSWMNSQMSLEVWEVLEANLVDEVGSRIYKQVWDLLWNWLRDRLQDELKDTPKACLRFCDNFINSDSEWANYAGLYDFCIHELGYRCDEEQWNLYKAMCSECNYWFLPSPEYYIVCDRPIKMLFNEQGQLHSDEEPAIQFIDGFGLSARHGEISSICYPSL
ncbi:hypothetical protein C7H19_17875 [Aphanothece hegewaldii CCALA 016]|uniref:Uncharacterized protein n=1 Tax=Aphanothece hegewaldii CCALA 016 TaxID=2107694 RepID=A0A2T1LU80_9CHRO|nr:hypothetical protein [Aphanothece hegewaldii]PSF35012.1 hypothetical protein C7H19_17875 [Aphanothece hegewaldii CCALA 016]